LDCEQLALYTTNMEIVATSHTFESGKYFLKKRATMLAYFNLLTARQRVLESSARKIRVQIWDQKEKGRDDQKITYTLNGEIFSSIFDVPGEEWRKHRSYTPLAALIHSRTFYDPNISPRYRLDGQKFRKFTQGEYLNDLERTIARVAGEIVKGKEDLPWRAGCGPLPKNTEEYEYIMTCLWHKYPEDIPCPGQTFQHEKAFHPQVEKTAGRTIEDLGEFYTRLAKREKIQKIVVDQSTIKRWLKEDSVEELGYIGQAKVYSIKESEKVIRNHVDDRKRKHETSIS